VVLFIVLNLFTFVKFNLLSLINTACNLASQLGLQATTQNSNKLIQSNPTIYYAKVVRAGYMFRPRFEAIFRPFVVEQIDQGYI
jgi:hypothetical protein